MERTLAQIPCFHALPVAQRRQLAGRCELRRVRKGGALFEEGQPADAVWFIQRGGVYLVKRTPLGAQATVYTAMPEDGICGFSAVAGEASYCASAVAATDTTAVRVPATDCARLLRQQPAFAAAMLAMCHARLRRMAEAISLAQAPVERRLAYTLLRLSAGFGKTIPVTHRELARMVGTRCETSIRTVAAFKRRHWLATSRGRMTVLRPDRLKALVATAACSDVAHQEDGRAPGGPE